MQHKVSGPKNEKLPPLSLDEWVSVFHDKGRSDHDNSHGWCQGSLTNRDSVTAECAICGCIANSVPQRQGLSKNLFPTHLKSNHKKGLYLLRIGAVHGSGDYCKVGSSEDMLNRMFEHLRDRRHQKAEVLHIVGRSTNWKTTEGVEGMVVGRLRDEFPSGRLYEEYFPYNTEFVQRAIELLDSPKLLVDDLDD